MLPDPYAANWTLPDEFRIAEAALSVALRWHADAPVAVQRRSNARSRFRSRAICPMKASPCRAVRCWVSASPNISTRNPSFEPLDLSSRDHHFGVALESLSDAHPRIDPSNRLSVELRDVRLLMLPQVHRYR